MRAEDFGGYHDLQLADIPSPALSDGRVLVRMTAGGVTPLDHTIASNASFGLPTLFPKLLPNSDCEQIDLQDAAKEIQRDLS